MQNNKSIRLMSWVFATVVLVAGSATAQRPAPQTGQQGIKVIDIVLSQQGMLVGQVVDHQGKPGAGRVVAVAVGNKVIATAKTDAQGRFAVSGLRGGTYAVLAGDVMRVVRVWTPGTAPPATNAGLLMVTDSQVLRAQGMSINRGLLLMSGIAGGIIAVGELKDSSS